MTGSDLLAVFIWQSCSLTLHVGLDVVMVVVRAEILGPEFWIFVLGALLVLVRFFRSGLFGDAQSLVVVVLGPLFLGFF